MSYTNLQLLRRVVGDPGDPVNDLSSGDAVTTIFYISSPPIAANSQAVYVGGALKTEGSDYTLDDVSGKLIFSSAPASGTNNILVDYTSVRAPDPDLIEALRMYGLTDSATADIGPALAILQAAVEVCEWTARRYSDAVDITTDGQSIARSQIAKAFADRAKEFRVAVLTGLSGVTTIPVQRSDGYNAGRDVASNDVFSTGSNPRRRYYGQPDRIP